ADSLSELGYDHAGPLYHRILGSAKSDGAFYTNNLSAVMLARLALRKDFVDWADADSVSRLRIIDPACGTGTLLMASLRTIIARMAEATELDQDGRNALHRKLVEDVLCGLDINQHAIQLAACNLTLGAPTVDYARMNLLTMPHGPQPDGTFKAGSLEILNAGADRLDLIESARPRHSLGDFEAEQVNESEMVRFPLRNVDAVIMNAPFTDNTKRGRKFSPRAVKGMQANEIDIRDRLEHTDRAAGRVITTNSIRTFFTPLADQILNSERGVLAKVIPATACIGASGLDERRFIAERFHVERIVTTHDPKRVNFSENTSIHECLLVCRRWPKAERPQTEFVSLARMPQNATEAVEAAEAISSGNPGEWGNVHQWPADRVRDGDWTPVQWYDGTLAAAAFELDSNKHLAPAELYFEIGPAGKRIRDTYESCNERTPGAVRLFWSVSSDLRREMHAEPEDWRCPKVGKEDLAGRYWRQRSHMLVSARYDTIGGRLTAVWTPSPSVGSGWCPVAVDGETRAKALTAWWNSTPARLMLLNQRSKKLTYAAWSLVQLRQIRVPTLSNPAWDPLSEAFEEAHGIALQPMGQAQDCPARRIIDKAAALAIGVEDDLLADWRRRLAAEPTVAGTRADPHFVQFAAPKRRFADIIAHDPTLPVGDPLAISEAVTGRDEIEI
ncbi:MAG: N-6 DNA methylase, partial [Gammaproteobacteria bacterium]|nr:N-6 DNA methylase [Gammaproteobacteria bacterium]